MSNESCSKLYRDPQLHDKPDLLMQRGGAYYSEAAINLLCGLFGDSTDVQVVDVRNNGIIPELPADAVIEVPARVGAARRGTASRRRRFPRTRRA